MLTHFTILVSHHARWRLVHPDMWYLNAIHHHDGCRLVPLAKWEHFFNAIRHHDGCRLVHPAKWDIGQFRGVFMTDADWGILPDCSFGILIQFKMSRIDQFIYNSINLSHAINRQTFQLSYYQIHMHFCNIISKIYSFHIIISYLFGILPKHLK